MECLQHIIDVERVFQSRLKAFLDGLESFPAFDPDAEGTPQTAARSPQEVAAEFTDLRRASLEAIGRLQPQDLERRSRHMELGTVTLSEMLNEWPAHDLNHTVQAERALMQPFIQGCGPWQVYFKDHAMGST
jgi:tRNA A37 N6-isopentenylltransferase MiaA